MNTKTDNKTASAPETRPVCPNCGQWQTTYVNGYPDCFNECAKRGFVAKTPYQTADASKTRCGESQNRVKPHPDSDEANTPQWQNLETQQRSALEAWEGDELAKPQGKPEHSPTYGHGAQELARQRDELHRLWNQSSAEARRNKAHAEKLAEALRKVCDCDEPPADEVWKEAEQALADWEASKQ